METETRFGVCGATVRTTPPAWKRTSASGIDAQALNARSIRAVAFGLDSATRSSIS
jgi:hypothetical protein